MVVTAASVQQVPTEVVAATPMVRTAQMVWTVLAEEAATAVPAATWG